MKVRVKKHSDSHYSPSTAATWDAPPRNGEPGYDAFKIAFKRYLNARTVVVRKKSAGEIKLLEDRDKTRKWSASALGITSLPSHDIRQDKNLSLMPFQVRS